MDRVEGKHNQSFKTNSPIRTNFTAEELAGLPGMPGTPRGVQKRADRQRWGYILVKAKGGPGGKRKEYSIECLPFETREVLAKKHISGPFCLLPEDSPLAIGAEIGSRIVREADESEERKKSVLELSLAEFLNLPLERQLEAKAKLALLQAREGYNNQSGIKQKVKATQNFCILYNVGEIKLPEWVTNYAKRSGKLSVSPSSLNRWSDNYEKNGLLGLVNRYVTHSKTSVPEDIQKFVQGLYTTHPHIKMQRIFDAVDARFNNRADMPSHNAIRRYAKKWKENNEALFLYLSNPDEWRNTQQLAFGSASEKVVGLNQLWEMDSTPTDVMLKDGRHSIVACIDVWSRRAKILVARTSKSAHVSALIRRCMLDWGCLPATREYKGNHDGIKTDNGADYTSTNLETVLFSLNINHPLCPPFTPESKPHIERFNRTFSHGIVELLPGYVGHNVSDRKAIEARRSFTKRLMKKGEDPINIELTAEAFQSLCDRWCNAIYHQDVHGELGMSPFDKAQSWTGEIRRIENERALDMLLLPQRGLCTLQKKGIKLDHGWYLAEEFAWLTVGEKLRVYEDLTDFGTIYVYKPDGKFICVAQDPNRTGIDRTELACRTKAIQKKILAEGAKELRKQARKLGTEKAFEEILAYREQKLSERNDKVTHLPKRTEPYTSEALEQAGIAAEARQKQVIDPEQRRKECLELMESMAETGKLATFPTDTAGRIRLYRQLDGRVKSGEVLSERETNWMEDFKRSPDGRMMAELENDCTACIKHQ